MRINKFLGLLMAMSAVIFAAPATALPSDWTKEMVIQSDRAELDRKTGMVIYEGKVELVQGTLKIQSDRLLVIMDGSKLKQAVAEGGPARYQQQVTADKPVTNASANRIDFYAQTRELAFTGNAELSQENNRFSGESIRYELDTERVTASGNNQAPTSDEPTEERNERVRVVIQPSEPEPMTEDTSTAQDDSDKE